jgi:prefoldin subunit 5
VRALSEDLSASQKQAAGLQGQLAVLQASQNSLQASLEGKQTAEAALGVQLAQVGRVPPLRCAGGTFC